MKTIRNLTLALAGALFSQLTFAATYFEIFTEADAIAGNTDFLETVVSDGDNTVVFTRAGSGGVDSTEIRSFETFNGNGFFGSLVDNATWVASRSGSGEANGFNGASITSSGEVRFFSFSDRSYNSVNLTTGAVSTLVSATDFDNFTGLSTNVSAFNSVASDGSGIFIDFETDSVLGVSAAGTISTAVGASNLAAFAGTSYNSIAYNGTNILVGSNTNDEIVSFDAAGVGTTILTTAQIESVTDDIDGRAGAASLFYAPDGLVYFYENDSDYILSFDPNDAENTLEVVISEADLIAGPNNSDAVNQLTWFNGQLAWTDQSDGFYAFSNIPEPSTAILGLLGALSLLRRKRA
ncbi:MAG: hypothetical protein AAGC74_09520 [Verrucomicrobiota bacterium]